MTDTDPLEAAWAEVDARWEDEAAHERLVALADALDRLGEVGARYRRAVDEAGPRKALAERYQQQVVARALGRLARTPQVDAGPRRSLFEYALYGLSASLVAAALWSMLRTLGH